MWEAEQKTYGIILFVLAWAALAGGTSDAYQSSNVRTWSGWFNTDNPQHDGVEDERADTIRMRGHTLCAGGHPVNAICRDANDHSLVFSAETTRVTNDFLIEACTKDGLLCRNADQTTNETCRDYEIKFECLGPTTESPPPNLEVIGVAAGLSVIVPILCVAVMHIARKCRDRRQPARDTLIPENSEQSVQTDGSDLPPSYSFLFPSSDTATVSGNSQTGSSVTVSLVAPSGDRRSRLSSGSLPSLAEYQGAVNNAIRHPIERQSSRTSRTSTGTSAWRSRFPNMHLSVFDLFRSSDRNSTQHSSPSSPDLSYIQTPPPTYKEAIVIIGYPDPARLEKLDEKP